MKFAKIEINSTPHWAVLEKNALSIIDKTPFEAFQRTGQTVLLVEAHFLAPVLPSSKIVCVGWNYLQHTREDDDLPEEPSLFLKPLTAAVGHQAFVHVPSSVVEPKFEAEFAIVIGKKSKNLQASSDIYSAILGYTAANDFTAKELLEKDKIFTRAKGFDTFLPLGPFIETDFDYKNKKVQTYVNGELKQDGTSKDMIFSPEKVLSYITSIMTLHPGDIILTGTPKGAQVVENNDIVEVRIEGLSPLQSKVKRV